MLNTYRDLYDFTDFPGYCTERECYYQIYRSILERLKREALAHLGEQFPEPEFPFILKTMHKLIGKFMRECWRMLDEIH